MSELLRITRAEDGQLLLETSIQVLKTLKSCVNETLEALDDQEFATRVGPTREEVELVLRDLRDELRPYR
jgi:hypothetical protein